MCDSISSCLHLVIKLNEQSDTSAAEFIFLILLKLELLAQFSASNDEKYLHLSKIDIYNIELLD